MPSNTRQLIRCNYKEAKLVRAGSHGDPVTDGVFPESKEFLAGYWIVDAHRRAHAPLLTRAV